MDWSRFRFSDPGKERGYAWGYESGTHGIFPAASGGLVQEPFPFLLVVACDVALTSSKTKPTSDTGF